MKQPHILAIDLGGTKLNIGVCCGDQVISQQKYAFDANANESDIMHFITSCIETHLSDAVQAIGIGVPSVVDTERGIVFDVVNIPAWQKVHLKDQLQAKYNMPVVVHNDVNCFAVAEQKFGAGQNYKDLVGICLGTGMGVGLVLEEKLYRGVNSGAGEFGAMKYLDKTFDDYCSGQFFVDHFEQSGESLFEQAQAGSNQALAAFDAFGQHLASALSNIMLALDPQAIVIGGSVAKAFPYFIESMWRELAKFPYQNSVKNLEVKASINSNSALLGAAYLCQLSLLEKPQLEVA